MQRIYKVFRINLSQLILGLGGLWKRKNDSLICDLFRDSTFLVRRTNEQVWEENIFLLFLARNEKVFITLRCSSPCLLARLLAIRTSSGNRHQSLRRFQPAWPDVGIKSSPNVPKAATILLKSDAFHSSLRSCQIFGQFCKNIYSQKLSKFPIWSHWSLQWPIL